MRREQADPNFERDSDPSRASRERGAAAADRDDSIFWIGALGTLLLVLLSFLLAVGEAIAEPAAVGESGVIRILEVANGPAVGVAMPVSRERLDALMRAPTHRVPSAAEMADESIAAAVERGTNPDLIKPSAFRKRNTDLFRTERPVAIGEQELLLRLRLRAKTRRAMSVEVRF